jgi:uncharacterized protein (DUF2147 family)
MEPFMKTITLAAALLLASTAAYADSYNFEIQGQKIRIEAPKNCSSLSCIKVSAPGIKGVKNDDVATAKTPAAPPAPPAPPAPAPVTQTTAAASQAPTMTYAPPPPAPATTTEQPLLHDVVPGAPQPPAAVPPAPPATAPVLAAAPAAAQQPSTQQPVAQQPVTTAANTPIGVWNTEDGKANVKIEQCGANLCGYTADTHEQLLINMKPDGAKWSGRIHDPDSGRNYNASIAMKDSNLLKVQGCAFGNLLCGGQTWKRVS